MELVSLEALEKLSAQVEGLDREAAIAELQNSNGYKFLLIEMGTRLNEAHSRLVEGEGPYDDGETGNHQRGKIRALGEVMAEIETAAADYTEKKKEKGGDKPKDGSFD